MNNTLRLIGDCHGLYNSYHNLIKKPQYSIQLGDFGFEYDTLKNVDPTRHKILGGNHDNYDVIQNCPNYLGDFGTINLDGLDIFFIRDAYSVDKQYRIPGVSWWPQEELSYTQCLACIDLYDQVRPDLVISHDCPEICKEYGILTNPDKIIKTSTGTLLQELLYLHSPRKWYFCHHHKDWWQFINNTDFRCLNELSYEDISL